MKRALLYLPSIVYLILGGINVFWGRMTADEGWYLYASTSVYNGALPYRDFLFTQMPMLPYVYGLPAIILGPSILVGRIVSLCLGGLTIFLTTLMYKNRKIELTLVALFLSFNLSFVFDTTIIKTQGLTVLLATSTLFFLHKKTASVGLCALILNLLILTRLSFLPVFFLGWAYLICKNPSNKKKLLLMLSVNTALLTVFAIITNVFTKGNFVFGVLHFHDAYFPEASWSWETVYRFLERVMQNQGLLTILVIVCGIYVICSRVRNLNSYKKLDNGSFIIFCFLCWGSTSLIHGSRLVPYATYQTSNMPFAIATVVLCLGTLYVHFSPARRKIYSIFLLAAILISLPYQEYPIRLDGKGSIGQHKLAIDTIQSRHGPHTKTMLTFNPELAAETGHTLLTGYEMGTFSYFSHMDSPRVKELNVINERKFIDDIDQERADIVALTGENFTLTLAGGRNGRRAIQLFRWLQIKYRLHKKIRGFGQLSDTLYIYVRRRP